jgi:glycosyltransferase involved in cell wall biosynthesis
VQQPDRGLVMLFTRWYLPSIGSTQAVVHNMAGQLLRQGFRVRLFAVSEHDVVETPRTGLTIVRVAEKTIAGRHAPIASWWLTQRHVSRLLESEEEKPVAVHAFDATFGWAAVNWARRNGVMSVVTLTDDDVRSGSNPVAAIRKFVVGRTLRHAGLITSPSQLLAGMAADSQGAKNVHIVPHGIDFTAAAVVENALHVRRRFGIPADAFVFISVQQLNPGKTPVNAIRAFSRATYDRRHAFMLIVGDGPGRAAVERVALETNTSDRVVLAGAIPPEEVAAYMRASDAFVLDTAYESF